MTRRLHLHEKRGVTFQELGILYGVRTMLDMGLMGHAAWNKNTGNVVRIDPNKHDFNMQLACAHRDCGTVTCIGGAMGLLMGIDPGYSIQSYVDHKRSASLQCLFYPDTNLEWQAATPEVAVMAIDNWLKDGNPRWAKLLPKKDDY